MMGKRYIDDPVEQKRRAILNRVADEMVDDDGENGIVDRMEKWIAEARRLCDYLLDVAKNPDVSVASTYLCLDDLRFASGQLASELHDFSELVETFNDKFKSADKEIQR